MEEKLIIKEKVEPNKKEDQQEQEHISFFKLQYSLSSRKDNIMAIVAGICSLIQGFAFPVFSYLFGKTMNKLQSVESLDKLLSVMTGLSINYLILGGAIFFSSFMMISFWTIVGKTLALNIKRLYFKFILRQEQAYFDSINTFEFATKVQNQTKLIEAGIGIKIGNTIMSMTIGIVSLAFAFAVSWKLTLVMFTVLPFIAACGVWLARAGLSIEQRKREKYEKAGGIAEEVLYGLKTVASFANFGYEEKRFDECIDESEKAGYKDGLRTSTAFFFLFFFIYASYSLAIWYGSILIYRQEINPLTGEVYGPGDVISVLLSIIYGAMALGTSGPNMKAINAACEASTDFFKLEKRVPKINKGILINTSHTQIGDSYQNINKGIKLERNEIKGKIEFINVSFAYPAGPNDKENKPIFENLNFEVEAGTKVAIVGESGSGKSTIVNLLERLYEIDSGNISVDGVNLLDIDLQYWRSIVGYVNQEPMLFNSSLKDNIIFGRESNNYTQDDLNYATEKSLAIEFTSKYKEGLDYIAGIKGSRLSGGQKQRVAIARAIIGRPKFLIFDEATSALDNNSEKEIQKSLENVSEGITTIIIAHRLSTVINADKILVLDKGKIVEQGTHSELIALNGYYKTLVNSQIATGDIGHTGEKKALGQASTDIKDVSENLELEEDEKKVELEKEKEEEFFKKARSKFFKILGEVKFFVGLAFCAAFLSGASNPGYGFLISRSITGLSMADKGKDEMYRQSVENSIIFLIFAFYSALSMFILFYSFSFIGEKIVATLRKQLFRHYLRLHLGFFDEHHHSPGSLLTKLSTDTTKINGIAFSAVGTIIQSIASLGVGLGLGFYYEWRLALTCCGFVPLLVISSQLQIKRESGFNKQDEGNDVKAGSILSESVNNTKTVFAYNFQKKALQIYTDIINEKEAGLIKYSITGGLWYGFSQFVLYAAFATLYYIGARLLVDGKTDYDSMNKAIFCVIMAAFGMGNAQIYLGDMNKARESLISIYKILETPTEIEPFTKTQEINTDFQGKIEFKNVNFEYPTRPGVNVLKNVSFTVSPGQSVAFVGPSGSGKSSIIQLIERFYEVSSGEILIDGVNIKCYSIAELRKKIGIVLQEPTLFKISIKDNIRYGELNASDEEVRAAANRAYIGKFFEENIDVDATNFDKSLVSGGEKQRIAIARAILKNPNILLLDEATSALDKNSEEIVQKALDDLLVGRTSVVVAHRLSTIEKSDVIFYISEGQIREQGTHKELLNIRGLYYSMYSGFQKDDSSA